MSFSPKVYLLALAMSCFLAGCGSTSTQQQATNATASSSSESAPIISTALGAYTLTGNTSLVRDPSIIRQGNTYYAFSSDPPASDPTSFLSIRCSTDKVNWEVCEHVFDTMPSWIQSVVPQTNILWAPDISYFNGEYHVYYAASTLNSQVSAIGEATNATLDSSSPDYQWVDQGEVIASTTGDDFNAIDPNIFIDTDGSAWLTYGSYWSGIKQQQIDVSTGKLASPGTNIYSLASRPAALDYAIEASSLVHHGNYYYLFLSVGLCCEANILQDNYEQIVGRSSSPHGPFVDMVGSPLTGEGGTVLLQGNTTWNAPGGGTAYLNAATADSILVFHAANLSEGGAAHLWLKEISWEDDWPVLS